MKFDFDKCTLHGFLPMLFVQIFVSLDDYSTNWSASTRTGMDFDAGVLES